MSEWYVLDGRSVVPVASYEEYAVWRAGQLPDKPSFTKRVAADDVNDVYVSTVFLGMNHQWGDGPPLVFETMTFDHRETKHCDEWQWRWSTLDEAEEGHRAIVAAIARGDVPDPELGA